MYSVSESIVHWDRETLNQLLGELVAIRIALVQAEGEAGRLLRRVHSSQLKSARNLVHYLALRRMDLRPLQPRLTALGLSSLGRSEAHVMASLDAVIRILHALARKPWPSAWDSGPVGFEEGRALLKGRTLELLGPKGSGRWVRIMATMPSEAAENPDLVRELLEAGMNCMRVNCAHDNARAWRKMVRHLQAARRQTGLPCCVLFDLGGPKLRTGPLAPGPHVLKWRPRRDVFGSVTAPARIWLTPSEAMEAPPEPADAVLPLPRAWLRQSRSGDLMRFEDARKASREIKVTSVREHSRWAECRQTAYVQTGVEFVLEPAAASRRTRRARRARIGNLPVREEPILLQAGDTLLLTRKPEPGHDAIRDKARRIKRPAHIC